MARRRRSRRDMGSARRSNGRCRDRRVPRGRVEYARRLGLDRAARRGPTAGCPDARGPRRALRAAAPGGAPRRRHRPCAAAAGIAFGSGASVPLRARTAGSASTRWHAAPRCICSTCRRCGTAGAQPIPKIAGTPSSPRSRSLNLTAIELPFERERRVAISADIAGTTTAGTPWRIRLVNLHLDARSSWRKSPSQLRSRSRRGRCSGCSKRCATTTRYAVLGGDFNSWVGGADEPAVRMPQERRLRPRDAAPRVHLEPAAGSSESSTTCSIGFPPARRPDTREIEDAYGSDHRPLLGWVQLDPN